MHALHPSLKSQPKWFWIADIIRCKQESELPEKKYDADCVRRRAPSFEIVDGQLYKRSFGCPLLCCLLPDEAKIVSMEAHRVTCAAHHGANTLARKLIIKGFYWHTMVRDCIDEVRKCPTCQAFAKKDA
ncbi:PREDICTED: uncharacterized protein LOC109150018 [Ipomoea nil]|uniref:uncharacterized protein LOC109150018 n=1 Tax=Ipomoea nil TaxID=35883 RepID=UPI000900E6D1|nr:PREDICTED: uncharacterized protein LOC109150018 [Ipomoea nil]